MDGRKITKIARNLSLYKNKQKQMELNETEYEMVRYITKREYRTPMEIATYLNVDKGLVSRMLKKLNTLDYIYIEEDPGDSRRKLLKATSKAYALKDDIYKEEMEYYDRILSVLSIEEQEQFSQLLEKIYLESKRIRKEK